MVIVSVKKELVTAMTARGVVKNGFMQCNGLSREMGGPIETAATANFETTY